MTTKPAEDHNTGWYRERFEEFQKQLNGQRNSDLHAIRKQAIEHFERIGFPTTRNEEWKYTDVTPIARAKFIPATGAAASLPDTSAIAAHMIDDSAHCLVFINGFFSSEYSTLKNLPSGMIAGNIASAITAGSEFIARHLAKEADYGSNAFTALSTAFIQDGGYIIVPAGVRVDKPVYCLFCITDAVQGSSVVQPRNLIIVGDGSELTVIEQYVSLGARPSFTNTLTEMVVGENAVVRHTKIQSERTDSYHVGLLHVRQERSSVCTSNSISVGGQIVRNDIAAILGGEGAECTLNGLYIGSGRQHIDNHTLIDHAKPHCSSIELYKGILAGNARGVFNGKILVRQDAQKTDAKQTNKNLILSDTASIDTKPQLEIYANDVKCTHGATIGQMDEDALFYLRTRGIGLDEARDILLTAFAGDVIDRATLSENHVSGGADGGLRGHLLRSIHSTLSRITGMEAAA